MLGKFTRTVTNVGSPNSTYHVSINTPDSINVTVKPSVLSFTSVGEKKSFIVIVTGPRIAQMPIMSGSLIWGDGVRVVRTTLVTYTVLKSASIYCPRQTSKPTSTSYSIHY